MISRKETVAGSPGENSSPYREWPLPLCQRVYDAVRSSCALPRASAIAIIFVHIRSRPSAPSLWLCLVHRPCYGGLKKDIPLQEPSRHRPQARLRRQQSIEVSRLWPRQHPFFPGACARQNRMICFGVCRGRPQSQSGFVYPGTRLRDR